MIEFLVILCDTNHRGFRVETVRASDIDVAARDAIDELGRGRYFVVGVIEGSDLAGVMEALVEKVRAFASERHEALAALNEQFGN